MQCADRLNAARFAISAFAMDEPAGDIQESSYVIAVHQSRKPNRMIRILIDADACPVKDEIYRVAVRYSVPVVVVSNSPIRTPKDPLITRKIVSGAFDAADDWIVENSGPATVVITADILLADRCLKLGATVISPTGKPFTTSSIGSAIAVRAIMADLRAGGDVVGGPAPFSKADRSRFLSSLDRALVSLRRQG